MLPILVLAEPISARRKRAANRKASGLFEMLDPQPRRERWRSAVFLISLGCNPLKSLDSEK
jgi:hypothetical protein